MSISCPNKPLQENRRPEHNFSAWNLEETLSVTKSLTGGLEPFASCQDTDSFPTPGDKWPCPQWNCQESIISWTEFSFPARCPTPKPHIVCRLAVMTVGKGQSRKCHTRYLSLFLLFRLRTLNPLHFFLKSTLCHHFFISTQKQIASRASFTAMCSASHQHLCPLPPASTQQLHRAALGGNEGVQRAWGAHSALTTAMLCSATKLPAPRCSSSSQGQIFGSTALSCMAGI